MPWLLRFAAASVAFFAAVSSARADEPTTPPSQPAPDTKAPDAKAPDAKAPDAKAPDAPPDAKKPDSADKPDATSNGAKTGSAAANPTEPPKVPPPPAAPHHEHQGTFQFGSYGRVVGAVDGFGGPGRNANIVANGSRLDEDNYVEAELRREDIWEKTGAVTRAVITLAIASPIFHWDADFSINMAVRNLYLEEQDLGLKGLSVWAGSRMLRGDDIYVLDWWPLDNLNTLGAGVGYERLIDWGHLATMLHVGVARPDAPFYYQQVERPAPLDQFGTVSVDLLNRVRVIGSLRAEWNQRLTNPDKGPGPGLKAVAYGEVHTLAKGVHETTGNVLETLPSDGGYVVGAEFMAYTGFRDTYVNAFVRYATGIAAYGQWASPGGLNAQKTTDGAHELVLALGANAEYGPVGIMLGSYIRSFRDAAPTLDYEDVDEGIVLARPTVFFGEIAGLSLEGSYQVAQRGVLVQNPTDPTAAPSGPLLASLFRFGVMPFLSPAGRGDFSRPQIRFTYVLTARDKNARALYPDDDVFHRRAFEHFFGIGAEWWFNSTTYGGI